MKNSTSLEKLVKAIEFHGENILIGFHNEPECAIYNTRIAKDYLILEIHGASGDNQIGFYFHDNEEITPSHDGIYHIMDGDGGIWSVKFYLAVNNIEETAK